MATASVAKLIADPSASARLQRWVAATLSPEDGAGGGANIVTVSIVFTVAAVLLPEPIAWMTTDRSRSTGWEWFVALVLLGCSFLPVVLLALSYVRLKRYPESRRWYHAGIAASFGAIAAWIVFCSVVTLFMTRDGARSPRLQTVELGYVWHALDAVPFLHVPATLGWQEPGGAGSHPAGGLLIVFELAVLYPVVRLLLKAYENSSTTYQTRLQTLAPDNLRRPAVSTAETILGCSILLALFLLSERVVFSRESAPSTLISRRLPSHVDVRVPWVTSPQVKPWMVVAAFAAMAVAWMRDVGGVRSRRAFRWPTLILGIGFVALTAACTVDTTIAETVRSNATIPIGIRPFAIDFGWGRVALEMALLAVASLAVLICFFAYSGAGTAKDGALIGLGLGAAIFVAATCAYILLADLGFGDGIPGDRVVAAADVIAWHASDMIPGVAIPDTLGWTPAFHASAWPFVLLALLIRLGILFVVAFPIVRFVQFRFATASPKEGAVTALETLDRFLVSCERHFRLVEEAQGPTADDLAPPAGVTDDIRRYACTVQSVLGSSVGSQAIRCLHAVSTYSSALSRERAAAHPNIGSHVLDLFASSGESQDERRQSTLIAGRAMRDAITEYENAVARVLAARATTARRTAKLVTSSPAAQ